MLTVNPFAMLSAESGEHRLATVTHDELAHDMRPTCSIVGTEDTMLRDDDRRYYDYDVWSGGKVVSPKSYTSYGEAARWANGQGYRILLSPCQSTLTT